VEKVNSDYPWDDFDSVAYAEHNYSVVRDDDRQLIEWARDFFSTANLPQKLNGIDVGSGSNLYPTLAMLPWCSTIVQWEWSLQNVNWLRRQLDGYGSTWDSFWALLRESIPYRDLTEPRRRYKEVVSVRQASIFDLPSQQWDIGTMFFVAESLSREYSEFQEATKKFLDCLKPGSPFCAAFMEHSQGYKVGSVLFPAVSIAAEDLSALMGPLVHDLVVERIDAGNAALREGYSGMLLARGFVSA